LVKIITNCLGIAYINQVRPILSKNTISGITEDYNVIFQISYGYATTSNKVTTISYPIVNYKK
jgi:hypothetical protein